MQFVCYSEGRQIVQQGGGKTQRFATGSKFIQRASPACSAPFRPSQQERSERQISKLSKIKVCPVQLRCEW